MTRKSEQAHLLYLLGALLGPLERATQDPTRFDLEELERFRARFFAESGEFAEECRRFCESEPGHRYARQLEQIYSARNTFEARVRDIEDFAHLHAMLST